MSVPFVNKCCGTLSKWYSLLFGVEVCCKSRDISFEIEEGSVNKNPVLTSSIKGLLGLAVSP